MSETAPKPHWSHWAISVSLLSWNALGAANFVFQSDPNFVASLPPEYQELIANRPAWATIAFGGAVFSGALGALLLMFRTRFAFVVLAASALLALITVMQSFHMGGVTQFATTAAAAMYAKVAAARAYPGSQATSEE